MAALKRSTMRLAGATPFSFVLADFNHDKILDVAVANYATNTVSLLQGKANGSFLPPSTLAVGYRPSSIAHGDFNNDGLVDLAVANYGGGSVTILQGNGTGNFSRKTDLFIGSGPFAITANDFNQDKNIDLAVTKSKTDKISILLGKGNGYFYPERQLAAGISPRAIESADFDEDGTIDIAATNSSSATLSVLPGTGDGNFSAREIYPVGNSPASVAAGDVDGDQRLDLAVANQIDGNVSLLYGEVPAGQAVTDPVVRPTPTQPSTDTTAPSTDIAAIEQSVFQQINAYRASQGLPALTLNATIISEQARIHSQNMASGIVPFGHTGFETRIQTIAQTIPYRSAAENVAANQGYSDPASTAVTGWLNSPGHLANIVGNYQLTGIGVAKSSTGQIYFTQIFLN
ncbi:MAG: FG-GAP-like repeat-containing protein [Methylobacter sp.]